MDITRENFDEHFPEIESKIAECDFCSIDCEFTGITTYKNLNSFETPKTRYEKLRYGKAVTFSCLNSSLEFLIGQNFDFNKVFLKGLTYVRHKWLHLVFISSFRFLLL